MSFKLPDLAYDYNALNSAIDAQTMEIHHSKHHNTYVTNLNNALAGSEHEGKDLEELVRNAGAISPAVRNNGGGHWNHSFFWDLMTPDSMGAPTGTLADDIKATFGDFDSFKTQFTQAGLTRFGSGWAWLIVNAEGKLQITSTPNQDNPLMDIAEVKGSPILGLDVWEHAYYLRYQNRRPDYINAWWDVVNWNKVADLYQVNK
ncbi:superoxide dismutase [Thiomicrospira cyclica]|uniref:Superoxide dismutase n=1 Tax=Thiomicrospira cyclica (strain DSM 14477 / JCM 11371 / ALM1) TaxID=717773 RepID=F6D926_THICA|nr:superoxide dismutase [Thiomicrospira cyclica]AEG30857.1 Superoxide dismutase [Thiomicrospira cyclica ALM1]